MLYQILSHAHRAFVRRRLLAHGRDKMRRYIRVIELLEMNISEAETVCPSLIHYRRRGKACARLARKLSRYSA